MATNGMPLRAVRAKRPAPDGFLAGTLGFTGAYPAPDGGALAALVWQDGDDTARKR